MTRTPVAPALQWDAMAFADGTPVYVTDGYRIARQDAHRWRLEELDTEHGGWQEVDVYGTLSAAKAGASAARASGDMALADGLGA